MAMPDNITPYKAIPNRVASNRVTPNKVTCHTCHYTSNKINTK